jgi:hypothetical protein
MSDGKLHPAWMKIGLSVRIAQDLRLMLEPTANLSDVDQEERRRVFWSIYLLDKLTSVGRQLYWTRTVKFDFQATLLHFETDPAR